MTTDAPERVIQFVPEGAIRELGWLTDPEILVVGPAGTGKTYGICQLIHLLCLKHPHIRVLMTRKTLTALTASALVTFQEKVIQRGEPVSFFGGSSAEPASFRYDNGSRIVVAGLDNPSKVLSSEYDLIYINEITEVDEETLETLTGRLRNGVLKHPRLIGDCNPTYDRHYLLQRVQRGQMRMVKSTFEDNPTLTEEYLATLSNMTGTRRQRFFLGEWVGMENAIYADYLDAQTMLVPIPENTFWTGRAYTGVDYGETPSHPSTVGTITESTTGVWWVRACWAATGGNTQEIEDEVRSQKVRFGQHFVMTDPTIRMYADSKGWRACDGSAGSRNTRVGHVVKLLEAKALRFDKYGEGVQELWDEMHMYRWETIETDTEIKQVPVRKDEDRVAQLEYAIEGAVGGPAVNVRRSELEPRPVSARRGRGWTGV